MCVTERFEVTDSEKMGMRVLVQFFTCGGMSKVNTYSDNPCAEGVTK